MGAQAILAWDFRQWPTDRSKRAKGCLRSHKVSPTLFRGADCHGFTPLTSSRMTEANSSGALSGSCTTSFPVGLGKLQRLFRIRQQDAFVTLPFTLSIVNSFG